MAYSVRCASETTFFGRSTEVARSELLYFGVERSALFHHRVFLPFNAGKGVQRAPNRIKYVTSTVLRACYGE